MNESKYSRTTRTDAVANIGIDTFMWIWKEVVLINGWGVEIDSICSDIADQVSVFYIVDMVVKSYKVMILEGIVYQV